MSKLFKVEAKENSTTSRIQHSTEELTEHELEELLHNNPTLLTGDKLLYVGRQVQTHTGKQLDLLAVDAEGRFVVVELKRGVAPREIIAQILDYTSWLDKLSEREKEEIAKAHFKKYKLPHKTLHGAFRSVFGIEPQMVIGDEIVSILFAASFSPDVISPAKYLYEKGVPIQCVEFQFFKEADTTYLLTNQIVGDEESESEGDDEGKPLPPEITRTLKQTVSNLAGYLEEEYGAWCSSFGIERLDVFKTYQQRSGHWTSSYMDWLFTDGTKLVLEMGVEPVEEGDSPYLFSTYIWTRTRSSFLSTLFQKLVASTDLLAEFEDESDGEKVNFLKSTDLAAVTSEELKQKAQQDMESVKLIMKKIFS